jgi:hypothetical protein
MTRQWLLPLGFWQRNHAAGPSCASGLGEKCDDDAVAEVISRLEELGYVDDKKFAASFAATRIATRPLGRASVCAAISNAARSPAKSPKAR